MTKDHYDVDRHGYAAGTVVLARSHVAIRRQPSGVSKFRSLKEWKAT
jgi:hypothetical protein